MQKPLDITFRGMTRSLSVERTVERWLGRLERSCGRIQRCSVVIDLPHRHRQRGNAFHVLVDVGMPGRQVTVSREPRDDENVYVSIADAFRAARRQLLENANRLQQ
jgi:hypothetical protein